MRKSRPPYPPEYRRRIVELRRGGKPVHEIVREFGVTGNSVRNWVKQAELDAGERHDGLTTDERAELVQLRRENRILREEKEILKKAAAWFAQETGSTPSRRSNS